MKTLTVHAESAADEPFLFELYASTRQEELDAWGWPPPARAAFLQMQFRASQGRRHALPGAEFQIIQVDGLNAGRMIVSRAPDAIELVDIALLPAYRNAGIGAAMLQRIFGEAAATQKPVRLHVLNGHRAERFYLRLGFIQIGETGLHKQMEWRAPLASTPAPLLPDAVKLPFSFDPASLQADFAGIMAQEFIPHFNAAYYEGDWSAVPLRSIGGRADHIYPDPAARHAFADTPLLARCPHVREVLAALPCPLQAVRFLRLKAGSVIKEHRDHELGFEDGEVRLHVPVITNPRVEFFLHGARVVMREGECWYLNVNQPHRVANHGLTDRIHLVMDCVVNDWLRSCLLAAGQAPAGA